MEHYEMEPRALSLCQKIENQIYVYHGPVSEWKNIEGVFSIVHDENCCGATQNILFRFSHGDHFILLSAASFLDFYKDSKLKQE